VRRGSKTESEFLEGLVSVFLSKAAPEVTAWVSRKPLASAAALTAGLGPGLLLPDLEEPMVSWSCSDWEASSSAVDNVSSITGRFK